MRAAKFIVQEKVTQIINTSLQFFFFKRSMREMLRGDRDLQTSGKTIVQGTMDVGINTIIYMELNSGPNMANGTCGKTIDRGSTVNGRSK
jgi:hypothetical protein